MVNEFTYLISTVMVPSVMTLFSFSLLRKPFLYVPASSMTQKNRFMESDVIRPLVVLTVDALQGTGPCLVVA